MNIKSIGGGANPIEPKTKSAAKPGVKAESSSKDREGNGQRDPQEEGLKQELTDEELQEAVDYLKNLKGFQDNDLQIRVEEVENLKVIFIEDKEGNVIRRVTAPEIWMLVQADKPKGQILDKAM